MNKGKETHHKVIKAIPDIKYRGGRNHFMGDKKGFMAKTAFELLNGWECHIGRKGLGLSLQED